MDGENHGSKPYEQMDDLGGNFPPPIFWFNTHMAHTRKMWSFFSFRSQDLLRDGSPFCTRTLCDSGKNQRWLSRTIFWTDAHHGIWSFFLGWEKWCVFHDQSYVFFFCLRCQCSHSLRLGYQSFTIVFCNIVMSHEFYTLYYTVSHGSKRVQEQQTKRHPLLLEPEKKTVCIRYVLKCFFLLSALKWFSCIVCAIHFFYQEHGLPTFASDAMFSPVLQSSSLSLNIYFLASSGCLPWEVKRYKEYFPGVLQYVRALWPPLIYFSRSEKLQMSPQTSVLHHLALYDTLKLIRCVAIMFYLHTNNI